jgi:Asp-tRNA(Asn)/Glu-tRNA(Gln) amidotransferase A subunit family amidase
MNATGKSPASFPVAPWGRDPRASIRPSLPIGFQLVGAVGGDETLLDVAGEYERMRPWARLAPL